MERVRVVNRAGHEIHVLDLSNVAHEDALEAVAKLERIVQAQPLGTARTLILVQGLRFNRALTEALKGASERNRPHVKVSAVVGLSGMMTVIQQSISRLTGRKFAPFDDIEAALDYLASQK